VKSKKQVYDGERVSAPVRCLQRCGCCWGRGS